LRPSARTSARALICNDQIDDQISNQIDDQIKQINDQIKEVEMRHAIARLVALTLLAAALTIPGHTAAQGVGTPAPAELRATHLSPNAPALNIFIDGQPAILEVSYGTTTTHRPIAPGKHRMQVTLASDSTNEAVIDTTIDLIRGRPYTIALLQPLESIEAHLLSDSTKSPPIGQTRLRVIHAAPSAGAVDVWTLGSDAPLLTDQYFGQVDYVNLPPGEFTFRFAVAGTTGSLLTSQRLRLESGWTYTIALAGTGADTDAPLLLHASVDRIAP
jgi:Domain of unknown function (DUF4397)